MAGCLPTDPGRQRPDSRVVQPPSPGPEDGALVLMPQAVEGPSAVRVWRLHTHTPDTPRSGLFGKVGRLATPSLCPPGPVHGSRWLPPAGDLGGPVHTAPHLPHLVALEAGGFVTCCLAVEHCSVARCESHTLTLLRVSPGRGVRIPECSAGKTANVLTSESKSLCACWVLCQGEVCGQLEVGSREGRHPGICRLGAGFPGQGFRRARSPSPPDGVHTPFSPSRNSCKACWELGWTQVPDVPCSLADPSPQAASPGTTQRGKF